MLQLRPLPQPTQLSGAAALVDSCLASIEAAALAEFDRVHADLDRAGLVHLLPVIENQLRYVRMDVLDRLERGER